MKAGIVPLHLTALDVEQMPQSNGTKVTNDDPAAPVLWLLNRKAQA